MAPASPSIPGSSTWATRRGSTSDRHQPQPPNLRTTEEAERWKRSLIFRPELEAAGHLKETPELARLASSGITTVLATPPGVVFKGRSALVNVTAPPDEPQIGGVGDYRQGVQIVRAPVALHVEFPGNVRGDAYPVSLLGVIAFVRQSFLDAQSSASPPGSRSTTRRSTRSSRRSTAGSRSRSRRTCRARSSGR